MRQFATTAYNPTCGSGSLLLKVAAQAWKHITLEGQEKDVTTAGSCAHEQNA
jgi:type I restriction enzyme M protein